MRVARIELCYPQPHRDRDSTTGREYHFKGREPFEQMLRAVYTRFNTLPPSLYTLVGTDQSSTEKLCGIDDCRSSGMQFSYCIAGNFGKVLNLAIW